MERSRASTYAVIVLAFCGFRGARAQAREQRPSVRDIPGEVLVVDSMDAPSAWNSRAFPKGSPGAVADLKSETVLVREGTGAARWKCREKKRERFGRLVPRGRRDWTGYDQIQFWCYSHEATMANMMPLVVTSAGEPRVSQHIDWVGWRLVTVPMSRFAKNPNWAGVETFGFEDHTYRGGFFPLIGTDLVIDGVVVTKKILDGSLRNETGIQSPDAPITYIARVRNLSAVERHCRVEGDFERDGKPSREIRIEIEPAELRIAPGGKAAVEVRFAVPKKLLRDHRTLRTLFAAVHVTLNGHVVPQLYFGVPCRRFYFDTLDVSSHPRLLFTARELNELKERVKTDERTRSYWDAVRKSADKMAAGPVNVSRGDSRAHLRPLQNLSFAFLMTGERRYFDKARAYVREALKWENFNRSKKPGGGRQTDLATGHNSRNMGLAYDWLYDQWTEQERRAMRRQLVDKGLENHYHDCKTRDSWGHDFKSNWTSVASGGTGVGALAILGDEPDASKWAELSLERIDKVAEAQGADGGSWEGLSYWNYNIDYANIFADALRSTTRGEINLLKEQPWFAKACDFYVGCMFPEGGWVNFADAWHGIHKPNPSPPVNPHFLLMARELGDGYLQWKARNVEIGGYHKYGLWALLWYDPSVTMAESERRPLAQIYRGLQRVVMRSLYDDTDARFMAIRAGTNHEGHGHYDMLNFIISGYGYQLAADREPSNYSWPGYFGFTRHKNKRAGTFGHNCILIDGQGQQRGFGVDSRIKTFFHSPVMDYVAADGSKAYRAELLRTWRRHYFFVRPYYFIVWDEIESPKPVQYQWRLHMWSEDRDRPRKIENGAQVTIRAYKESPDKVAHLKVRHVAAPVAHRTDLERFPYDPQIDDPYSGKRSGWYVKTYSALKTDHWDLFSLLFPVDGGDAEGRGEFRPLTTDGAIGGVVRDRNSSHGPDTVLVSTTDAAVTQDGVSFTGRAALVSGTDRTTRYALVAGTRLRKGDMVLVSTPVPVTVALAVENGVCTGGVQAQEDTTATLWVDDAASVRLVIKGREVDVRPAGGKVKVRVPATTQPEPVPFLTW